MTKILKSLLKFFAVIEIFSFLFRKAESIKPIKTESFISLKIFYVPIRDVNFSFKIKWK